MNKEQSHMSKSRSTRRLAAAVIALSMFAVACGDDEKSTATTAPAETTTGSTDSAATISGADRKIAYMFDRLRYRSACT